MSPWTFSPSSCSSRSSDRWRASSSSWTAYEGLGPLRADRLRARARVPAVRAAARGALLGDGPGLPPDRDLPRDRRRRRAVLRRVHGAGLHGRARLPDARPRPGRARALPALPRRPRAAAGLEGVRQVAGDRLGPLRAAALRHPAHAGHPPVQPPGLQVGHVGRVVQHGLVVPDQHQLAVLRRGDDDVVLLADGRPGRPELHLGRRGHRRARRAHPRHRRAPR
jgi:hypothetical protein